MSFNYSAVMQSIFSYKNECTELSRKISEKSLEMLDYYKELKKLKKKYGFYQNVKEVKKINEQYDKKYIEQIKAVMIFVLYSEYIDDERYNPAYQLLYQNIVLIDVPPEELDDFAKELVLAKKEDLDFEEKEVTFMDKRRNQVTIPISIVENEDFLRTLYGIYNGNDPEEEPF